MKNIPLSTTQDTTDLICLPWGSIVDVEHGGESFPVITGHDKWRLPVCGRPAPNTKPSQLGSTSRSYRLKYGYDVLSNVLPASPTRSHPKALSIRQPWPYAIANLGKDVENRSWRSNYRGQILIHAAQSYDATSARNDLAGYVAKLPSQTLLDGLPIGCVIGVAELFDCVDDSKSKWAEPGHYRWLLRNFRPIKPTPCAGRRGLWTPTQIEMNRLPKWVQSLW